VAAKNLAKKPAKKSVAEPAKSRRSHRDHRCRHRWRRCRCLHRCPGSDGPPTGSGSGFLPRSWVTPLGTLTHGW